jgi:reactive intermediate/imine deaminase
MTREAINTENAPAAIGAYSQAMRAGNTVYISGQIPLQAGSGEMVNDPAQAIEQVFDNLEAIATAAGGTLSKHAVKIGVFLTDMSHFAMLNQAFERRFSAPFPARAAIQVARLPKDAVIEMDAVLYLG